MTVDDKPVIIMCQTQDAPEDYLVRREITTLYLAMTIGEAVHSAHNFAFASPNQVACMAFSGTYKDYNPRFYDSSIYLPGTPLQFPVFESRAVWDGQW